MTANNRSFLSISVFHSTVLINGFDGCIKDVKIMREPANLFENVRSKGIVKGCVPKVSSEL